MKEHHQEVTEKLKAWLEQMSNPLWDPWTQYSIPTSSESIREMKEEDDDDGICIDPTHDHPEDIGFSYRGTRDADGRFDVCGTVTYENGDIVTADFVHGVKEGKVVMISPRSKNVSRIVGRCVKGKLEGKGKIISAETSVTDCFFRNGCIDGPVRRFTMKKFREFRQQLDFLGTYQKGKPWGMCWEYREGGGFLVGKVDPSNGEFSADQGIAYLYPDLSTALLGAFVGGTMKAAKSTRLIDVTLDPSTQIMSPVFAQTLPHQPVMRYSKATSESIGHQPLVSDPYEDGTVRVRPSAVEGGGDGLFAQKDLAKGAMVAFYNGVRLPYRVGVKEEWATSGYKIYINADYESGERMDIPEECQSLDHYCATLGHKLNHSFRPNCEEWFIDHPRFGLIPYFRAKRDIKEGEELFLDYEYSPENCPQWFRDQLIHFKASMSEEEKATSRYAHFIPN